VNKSATSCGLSFKYFSSFVVSETIKLSLSLTVIPISVKYFGACPSVIDDILEEARERRLDLSYLWMIHFLLMIYSNLTNS